ncbi:MAG: hypothetical protein Tsb009_32470 [Planctomycetaceae bacterium]
MSSPSDQTNHASARSRPWLALFTILILAVLGALGVSQYQDWREQEADRRLLREMEAHALSPDNPPSPESFYPMDAVPRPPIVKGFQILSAKEAGGKVEDDELVLAVEVNGKSRAYPLNIMTGPSREVFNDTLGGIPIAATW